MAAKENLKSIRRKLVAVGNATVGKTTLLDVLVGREFSEVHYPNARWRNHVHEMEIDGYSLEIAFWDTAGQEDYDRLRPLSYPDSSIILICFAINDPNSFHAVNERWYPEVVHFCSKPKVPILLVGCKSDLGNNLDSPRTSDVLEDGIEAQDGHALAEKIGAVGYLECSSKTGAGIDEVLTKVARVVISWDPVSRMEAIKRGGCLIL